MPKVKLKACMWKVLNATYLPHHRSSVPFQAIHVPVISSDPYPYEDTSNGVGISMEVYTLETWRYILFYLPITLLAYVCILLFVIAVLLVMTCIFSNSILKLISQLDDVIVVLLGFISIFRSHFRHTYNLS